MGYDAAINKAWEDLAKLNAGNSFSVKFLLVRPGKGFYGNFNFAPKISWSWQGLLRANYKSEKLKS